MEKQKQSRMKNLSDALMEDACPLCTFLKEFQSSCLRGVDIKGTQGLCNYHTWMVANVARAEVAAEAFLRLMDDPSHANSPRRVCGVCAQVTQEEHARIEEFSKRLLQPGFRQWLRENGVLCLRHARTLLETVPEDLQGDILVVMKRVASDLIDELKMLVRNAKSGLVVHPGVLGRAAEYLAAQRGLGADS